VSTIERPDLNPAAPVARVASLLRYVAYLRDAGVAVDRVLAYAGIPEDIVAHPGAAIPLASAFRFLGLACRALGTEHLGLYVGEAFGLRMLGAYEQRLQSAPTVHAYMRDGIAFYNRLVTGQRLWLSAHGAEVRLNIETRAGGVAPYQSHLETMAATVTKLREAAGPTWAPSELGFAYRARERMPATALIGDARIRHSPARSYMTIPRALLARPIGRDNPKTPSSTDEPAASPGAFADHPLPDDFGGLVRLQLGSLMADRIVGVDAVAESLGTSKRSLQRKLAAEGLTYSRVLADVRSRTAARWLRQSDMSVGEIAFRLAYADASNFTRAFRAFAGVSPSEYRESSMPADARHGQHRHAMDDAAGPGAEPSTSRGSAGAGTVGSGCGPGRDSVDI
jgi:AraC-like DNA-binding protein